MPLSVLEAVQKDRKQQRLLDKLQEQGREEEAELCRAALRRPLGQLDGPGKPAQEKNRLTWLARQCIDNYFDCQQVPQGRALDSILIVKAASHCRLENISLAGTWIESEQFEVDGKLTTRTAGSKVHPKLLSAWRELREKSPQLFDKGVRIWGQAQAYMDSLICTWHSRLISKEVRQCIHQVDMFSGELTDTVRESNFYLHQLKHCIGAKQTAKLQLTDTTVSFPCKAAAQRKKAELRRRLLKKALQQQVPERLEAGPSEVMQLAVAMQAEAVSIADRGDYVRALRSACLLVYQPDPEGSRLVPCPGSWAASLPLAGHRVGRELSAHRLSWMSTEGKPALCDWSRLQKSAKAVRDQPQTGSAALHLCLDSAMPAIVSLDQDADTVETEGEEGAAGAQREQS